MESHGRCSFPFWSFSAMILTSLYTTLQGTPLRSGPYTSGPVNPSSVGVFDANGTTVRLRLPILSLMYDHYVGPLARPRVEDNVFWLESRDSCNNPTSGQALSFHLFFQENGCPFNQSWHVCLLFCFFSFRTNRPLGIITPFCQPILRACSRLCIWLMYMETYRSPSSPFPIP